MQVVTFNYDISLELYLFERVVRYFGSTNELAKEAFRDICGKIFHVYGQIAYADEILQVGARSGIEGDIDSFLRFLTICESEITNDAKKDFFPNHMGDIAAPDRHWNPAIINFCFLVLKNAISINWNNGKDKNLFLSPERIKVINQDRNNNQEIKKLLSDITLKQFDLLYILGYGFDHDNNKILNFDNLKKYQKGCFVTNFVTNVGVNQKLERIIYDDCLLCKLHNAPSNKEYKIPLVSHLSVSGALKEDFSFFERPSSYIKIETDLTPYFAMRGRK